MRPDKTMHYLKVACGFACFLVLASNVWSMSHWSEARGVYDDICYLRQAHLFQRFGLGGWIRTFPATMNAIWRQH